MLFTNAIRTAFVLSFAIASFAIAQERIRFTPPTPPDPGSPSDRGQGGGSRGPCDKKYAGLTALVPLPRPDVPNDRWGLTVSDRPIVWFDVPTGIDAPLLAQWQLRSSGKAIAKAVFQIPKTPAGVIGLTVPAPLMVGTYQWDLALYCRTSSDRTNSEFDIPAIRKGRIQRIVAPAPLGQELMTTKTPLDRANVYAKYGFWYDSLTLLGTQMSLPKTEDKEISETWNDLLRQQNLNSKTSAKVTSCCTFQNQRNQFR